MNNKTVLSLIEQAVMVLIFSVAAAICLMVFTRADRISSDAADMDAALLMAQNAAEQIKADRGASVEQFTELSENGLTLKTAEDPEENEFLGAVSVSVYRGEEKLCELPVRWQK